MTLEELKEELTCMELDETVYFENPSYETAVIGYTDDGQLVYDYEKMVDFLVEKEGMSAEEASDFISYDTMRAIPYVSGKKPIVVFPFMV